MAKRRNILLKIPSIFYGWGVALRNFAFDTGILKSVKPSIPTICVGNLSVGGTGKTPHIEWLIRHLRSDYKVAVLSRGYGRKTKGMIVATVQHSAQDIGDEPAQILSKFPGMMMYIDGDRLRAIRAMEMLPAEERPDVILMDDGFQHRYVKHAYSILLTPYLSPFTRDDYLPYGNLRESEMGKYRADTIIVTSTPGGLRPIDFRLMEGEISPLAHQDLYFSRVSYGEPIPLFAVDAPTISRETPLIVISGIANPENYHTYIKQRYEDIRKIVVYPDHYAFTRDDIAELLSMLDEDKRQVLLCTQKDAVRLKDHIDLIPTIYRHRLFFLPISIDLSPESTKRILSKAQWAIAHNGLSL